MSSIREITSFPLAPSVRTKLQKAGFRTAAEVSALRPAALAAELGLSNEEALEILKIVRGDVVAASSASAAPAPAVDGSNGNGTASSTSSSHGGVLAGRSALELLRRDHERKPIITFSESIDEMLGGGVPIGSITEFCGAPGIGKTQLGMQLAVNVQLPRELDGAGGHCIYIDTEGSFVAERAYAMAQAFVQHIHSMEAGADEARSPELQSLTPDSILSNIYLYRVHDYVEQMALVNMLPELLRTELPRVRLVIIDTVSFHFRHEFDDMNQRTRILLYMAQRLQELAEQQAVAVVLMNQVTTKFDAGGSSLVPALGQTWGHTCTNRVMLYWKENKRLAHLEKSPSQEARTVPFQVTVDGIRDEAPDETQAHG